MVYTDRWCFCNKNHKERKRFANFVSFFWFAMFDYRGDKVLVDHDSGLGWILLRIEISRHMKSHAVRPCARRRRGCPFPGPPCRPGRRRTCVYGRNELHPSRHGHLTGLGGVRTPRAEGGAGTSRAGPVMTPRAEAAATSAALPCGVARFHFGTLRREIPLIPTPTTGAWPDRAAHREGGGCGRGRRPRRSALGAGRPTVVRRGCGRSARVRPRQARPSRCRHVRTGSARVRPRQARPSRCRHVRTGSARKRLVRKSRFPFRPNKAILSFDVQYQRRRT